MLAQKDETIKKAVSILKDISKDEAMQIIAYREEMSRWKEAGEREATFDQGVEEGLEKGKIEGKIDLLYEMGYAEEKIAERLQLDLSMVKKILEKGL